MAVPFSRIVYFSLLALLKVYCLVVLGQAMQQGFNCTADNGVHQPEVRGEDEDGNEDHDRRRLNLGARRGDHLAHLAAHVLEELDETSWLRLQLLQSGAGLFGYCYCLGHNAASILVLLRESVPGLKRDPGKLAGELGFEPRSSVLETDSLTVELTPPVVRSEVENASLPIRLETTS